MSSAGLLGVDGLDRAARIALAALLTATLGILVWIAVHPLPVVDNIAFPDDAYLSLGIARNIALGRGPLQGLAPTNGFQPLYVFLMVPVYRLFPDDLMTPIRVALFLLIAFNAATISMLFCWLRRMTGSTLAAFVACLAWPFGYYVIYTTLGGLETPISVFFIVASFVTFHRIMEDDPVDPRKLTRLGVLLGLAVFARVDNVILAGVLTGFVVVRVGPREAMRALTRIGVPALLVNLPWAIYSWHYTHHIYPMSGPAVRFRSLVKVDQHPTFANEYLPMIQRASWDVWRANKELIVGIAGTWVATAIFRNDPATPRPPPVRWTLAALVLWGLAFFLAYTCFALGPWYYQRYLFPLAIAGFVLASLNLEALLSSIGAARGRFVAAVLSVALVGTLVQRRQFRSAFAFDQAYVFGYMSIGLWAHDRFPPGTRIGAIQSGALAYFTPGLTVVNLDGVVNEACFQALREHRALQYMREAGIQYFVGWENDAAFVRAHSASRDAGALGEREPIAGFRSDNQPWFLYKVE